MASTSGTSSSNQQSKVNWRSDTKDEEIQIPEGIKGD